MIEESIGTLKTALSGGTTPAMATPLKMDRVSVNLDVIPDLVEFLIEKDVAGIFAGGTTGEGILLDVSERTKLHEKTIEAVNKRVPVLVHVGARRLDEAGRLTEHAVAAGADGLAAVTPYFYGIHDSALADYYHYIADLAPHLPLFAYDIPHMAINGLSPGLAERLCVEIPSFAGLKTSSPDVQRVRRLHDAVLDSRIVLIGNESAALGSLALGGDGMISGLGTAIPEPFVKLTAAVAQDDFETARQQQRLINDLLQAIPAGARIGAIKAVLIARGVAVGPPVAPLPIADSSVWARMETILFS